MVFSSLIFIFIFLPGVLALYFSTLYLFAKKRFVFSALNFVLFATSLFFYISGEKKFFWVMLLVGLIDYTLALVMDAEQKKEVPNQRRLFYLLLVSVVSNMGLLFYFKYAQFASELLKNFFSHSYIIDVALPIGISFYTFESMSYIIDVYRGHIKATRRFIDYWAFITFFPHLVAGPIIRYVDLKRQLESRSHSWDNLAEGFRRFSIGLGKKVIISNPLGYYADILFALDSSRIDTTLAWVAACTYTLQIYFDFSGYSDMAIGLAKMFGIELPENFNAPYIARSIKDFWRRWHMTLSQWFRDYLYIPLGGNRDGAVKEYRNLFLVFVLCGLWHGANVTFFLWGCYHGFFLVAERIAGGRISWRAPSWLQHVYALVVIIFSWVIFRAESLDQIINIYKKMVGWNAQLISSDTLTFVARPHFYVYFLLGILFCTPFVYKHDRKSYAWSIFLFLLSCVFLCGQEYNPFIYFRF
jgi:alginate O-acetyltransferase complex protein AlgI